MSDLHTVQVVTGAAEVAGSGALPNINRPWYLVRVALEGGAGMGVFKLQFAGGIIAYFPVGHGLHATWGLNWKLPANNIPDGNMTVAGDVNPETVELTFAAEPDPASPLIEAYQGLFVKTTQAGANAALLALAAANYDVNPSYPVGISAMTTVDDAEVFFPSEGSTQGGVMCELDTEAQIIPIAPAPFVKANSSLTLSVLNEAAAHISALVWAKPAAAGSK